MKIELCKNDSTLLVYTKSDQINQLAAEVQMYTSVLTHFSDSLKLKYNGSTLTETERQNEIDIIKVNYFLPF